MASNFDSSNGSRGVDSFDKERGISPKDSPSQDPHQELRNALAKQMTMSPELFESIYLQPKNNVAGDLRNRFGNPTPIALMGFSVALMSLSFAFSKSHHSEAFPHRMAKKFQWDGVVLAVWV